MLKKTLLIVWLLVSFSFLTKCEEECRFGHFSFIRIVNTRPSEDILSNLIVSKYSSLSSCYHQCHSDLNCSAYFVDHYRKECVFIMSFHLDMLSSNLEVSSNWSFHKKFCIPFGKLKLKKTFCFKIKSYFDLEMSHLKCNEFQVT